VHGCERRGLCCYMPLPFDPHILTLGLFVRAACQLSLHRCRSHMLCGATDDMKATCICFPGQLISDLRKLAVNLKLFHVANSFNTTLQTASRQRCFSALYLRQDGVRHVYLQTHTHSSIAYLCIYHPARIIIIISYLLVFIRNFILFILSTATCDWF
jgi:hypothetical protein